MLSYGAIFNTDIVYDLKDKESYISNGGSVGGGWPAGCSLVAVKIVALDDSIDINDTETRRNILTGQSFTVSGFLAVGGGIMKLTKYIAIMTLLLVFVFIQNSSIKEEEKIMRENIPNIYLYNTNQKMVDIIKVKARTENQVMGELYFKNIDDTSKVKKYYEENLKEKGWIFKNKQKILNTNNRYIGDKVIFMKQNYEFILNLYPPINEKWDKVKLKMILNKETPYYRIYIQKIH